MNFNPTAVNQLVSCNSQCAEESATSSSCYKQKESSHTSSGDTSDKLDVLVFQALKGYTLYKKEAKQVAIVDFLKISSFSSVFTSDDPLIIAKVESLCDPIKNILKTKGKVCSSTKWNST